MSIVLSLDEMRAKLKAELKPNRYVHSLGVADTAVFLAGRFGVPKDKAYLAGLLHDAARRFPNESLPAEADRRGLAYGPVERATPLLLHAPLGASLIAEEYGVTEGDILQAVARHTVGGKGMSRLDKIVYFADMIEPSRNYPEVKELRAYAAEKSLDEMLLKGLSEAIVFVTGQGHLLHPDTISARNEIILRNLKKEAP